MGIIKADEEKMQMYNLVWIYQEKFGSTLYYEFIRRYD